MQKYKVRYSGLTHSTGDYSRYKFSVSEKDKKEVVVYVRVSGTLTGRTQDDNLYWPKVAARAVELHLLSKIETENYTDGEIMVSTYWQPREPREDFEAFEVSPNPSMGLPGIK